MDITYWTIYIYLLMFLLVLKTCNQNGDKFVVKVRISGFSAARVYFDHFIYKLPNKEVYFQHLIFTIFLPSLKTFVNIWCFDDSLSWKPGAQLWCLIKTIVPLEFRQILSLKFLNIFVAMTLNVYMRSTFDY